MMSKATDRRAAGASAAGPGGGDDFSFSILYFTRFVKLPQSRRSRSSRYDRDSLHIRG